MVAQLDRAMVRARPGRVVPRLLSYAFFEGRPATTRGRWLNSAVRANLAVGETLGRTRPVRQPVFVLGIGRSGTTLLGRLLAVHSHVGFLNEPKAMWHRLVSDEDLIGSYGPEPVRLWLHHEDAVGLGDRAQRLFGWYLTATRSRRLVDKYPELVYRAGFVRALFPDCHLVVILRRPWDVITSIEAWERSHATDDADWWGVEDRKWRALWQQGVLADPRWRPVEGSVDPMNAAEHERAAVEWLLGTTAALELPEQLGGDRVHLVRYEDLVSQPERFMTGLLRGCDLPVEQPVLDLARRSVARQRPPSRPVELPGPLAELVDAAAAAAGYT